MFVTPYVWSLVGFACMLVYGSFFEWLRSKVRFAQVHGEAVPDVQPRAPHR
jgi:hypothetical protein